MSCRRIAVASVNPIDLGDYVCEVFLRIGEFLLCLRAFVEAMEDDNLKIANQVLIRFFLECENAAWANLWENVHSA